MRDIVIIANAGHVPKDYNDHVKEIGRVQTVKSPSGNTYMVMPSESGSKEDIREVRGVFPFVLEVEKVIYDVATAVTQIRNGNIFENGKWPIESETPYRSLLGVALNDELWGKDWDHKRNITEFISLLISRHTMRNYQDVVKTQWENLVAEHPKVKNLFMANFNVVNEVNTVWNKRTLWAKLHSEKDLLNPPYELGFILNQYGFIVEVELSETSITT